SGDGVVVGAVREQPPGLVQARDRIRRPGQPRGGGKPLAVEQRDLTIALRLLGVDVGDVLAGIHRVHIPGLRHEPAPGRGLLRPDGREEFPRYGRQETRPDVPGVPVSVDRRSPSGWHYVITADRQEHIASGGYRGERPELG